MPPLRRTTRRHKMDRLRLRELLAELGLARCLSAGWQRAGLAAAA